MEIVFGGVGRLQDEWQQLKAVIERSMKKGEIVIKKRKIGQCCWWDRECTIQKRLVGRHLKKWKVGKISREEFLEKRLEFRRFCENKERRKREQEVRELKQATTENQI